MPRPYFFFPNPTIAATSTEKLMTKATTTILFSLTNCPALTGEVVPVGDGVTVNAGVDVERSCLTGSKAKVAV